MEQKEAEKCDKKRPEIQANKEMNNRIANWPVNGAEGGLKRSLQKCIKRHKYSFPPQLIVKSLN